MELNKIKDNVFQLVDTVTGNIITQGSYDHCFEWMCELERLEEHSAWLANEI